MINAENFFYVMAGSALSLVGVVVIATGLNENVQSDQEHAVSIKQLQATQIKESERSELERQKANARYSNGCVLLQNQIEVGQLVSGVPVKTVVCDVFGLTAVVGKDGTVKDIVRTPDQSVIQSRISQ